MFIFIGSSSFLLFSVLFIAFNTTAHLTERNMKACCNEIECFLVVLKEFGLFSVEEIRKINFRQIW